MSSPLSSALRRAGAAVAIAGALFSGCAQMAPRDPEQQFVVEQMNAKALYDKRLASYNAIAANPGAHGRAEVLDAYQQLLYQYSVAAVSLVRAIDPPAREALPPPLQPLPPPSGTPTLADANRAYERALEIDVAIWDIKSAADWGKPSKFAVPKYTGVTLFAPEVPPLPPLQDARDPAYARLVAMTQKVDAAQKADLAKMWAAVDRQRAENDAWAAAHNLHRYEAVKSPQAPVQQEQRWCYQAGNGVIGRYPC